MAQATYDNWQLRRDADDLVWLHLDKANASTNVLSAGVLIELDTILMELNKKPPRGLVIISDKANGFVAGADINEFTAFETSADALQAIQRGQSVFNRIEALPCPSIALLHGFCLGGGLELALACRYRVADDAPATRLGLPEVRLGIHPGFGGSLRMIRKVGAPAAMNAMLSGRNLSARAAKKIGLVDYAIPQRHFENAARSIISRPPVARPLPFWLRLLNQPLLRPWVGKYLARQVASRAPRSHYPAPYALIDLWVKYYSEPAQMFAEEARSVAKLLQGKTAQNLIRVFKLQERLKGLGHTTDDSPRHVHVIGGGVMGGDIAAWCALRGFHVTVQDQKAQTLASVIQRANRLFKRRLKQRQLMQGAMDRLIPDLQGHGLRRADVVIEAIFEDVKVKQDLFSNIEPLMKDTAILATNTSSIPLDELSPVLQKPERLVGLHFFNPVAKMPLVEIVHSKTTSEEISARAAAFTRRIDRLPLPVTSTPGFLVNRILMPYLMEAVMLADEGVPLRMIDKAATDFGMPMGPIELADTVGLDICLKVAEILSRHMDIEVPKQLQRMIKAGKLGMKSSQGFYAFKSGKPDKPPVPRGYTAPDDLEDRLILRLLNEAVACIRDKVVEDADLADAGIIFGTGFAPFRGGPFHYIQDCGVEQLLGRFGKLESRHGARFKADTAWQQLPL